MADYARHTGQPEIQDGGLQTGSTYYSACRLHSNAISTAIPTFSGSSNSMALWPIMPDIPGNRKSKMAAYKPEVLITQPVDYIATRFQRLSSHFRGPATQRHYGRFCQTLPETGNPRWRLTNRKYLLLSL